MTAIGLLAAKGAPGVTTLAMATVLADAERGAALIEADPDGGDLALLHAVPQSPGLTELAARARRAADEQLLAGYLRPLFAGALPTLLAPVDQAATRAALDVLGRHPHVLGRSTAASALVLDFGRASERAVPPSLFDLCDALLLVTRGDLTSLAHAQAVTRQSLEPRRPTGFVLIDTGPYRAAEAETALGLRCAAIVPFDPKDAARLRDPLRTASASSPLVRAAARILGAPDVHHDAPQEVLI